MENLEEMYDSLQIFFLFISSSQFADTDSLR